MREGKRINLLLTPENHDYVSFMSKATGQNMTSFINGLIRRWRLQHPDDVEKMEQLMEEARKLFL